MKYAIIGGGIGGLTTALALRRRGIDAHVFEAAPELRAVGAGIWMPSNAMQVLDRLGVAGAVMAAGRAVERGGVWDERSGVLQSVDVAEVARRYGFGTIALHRAQLQRILAAELPPETLHTGMVCEHVAQDGTDVALRFQDGATVGASVVIGADGLRSTVRRALFPDARLRYSGQTSYRAVVRWRLPPELAEQGREVWGAGRRFGYSAVSDDDLYWFAVEDAAEGGTDAPGTLHVRLQDLFAAFPAPIPDILAASADVPITRTDISDLRPLPAWYRGRVVLIGDAAHATTPNLGQGGAQAIEDAWVLAAQLAAQADVNRAFAEFQRLRRRKADAIVRTSWRVGRLAHVRNPAGRALRNALLRLMPARVTDRQLASLFQLNY